MIRDYKPEDAAQIEKLHSASGFDYVYRTPDSPLWLIRKVVEIDGKVVQSLCCKLVLNINLVVSPDFGTPLEKWNRLKELVEAAKQEAYEKGLDEAYAVIPPEIDAEFAPWLEKLGMSRDRAWPKWSIPIE
jgi:hypothetical protein